MTELQLLNVVLAKKSTDILDKNGLTKEYFLEYDKEYDFIKKHIETYKVVPDTETFVAQFPDFELLTVNESERYLVDTIREEYLYSKSVPIIKKAAELLKGDANDFVTYMQNEVANLVPNYQTPFTDIIHDDSRVRLFEDKSLHKDKWFIPTGFQELDDIVGGWQMGEEYVVWFARTSQGKSWMLVKAMQHAWAIGKNVGYISPEMSANKIGYRFDTVNQHLSNMALLRGDVNTITVEEYNNYLEELSKHENKFIVSTPYEFNRQITVSKLKNYVLQNKLDILAVDGITYMTDERYKRGDNKTTTLTNISEDLIALSCELGIPIHIVVQSNRGGVKEGENDTPNLEDIRDSDGISHNATKVFALKQKEDNLILAIKKNRDGKCGDKLTYRWNIDLGEFEPIENVSDVKTDEPKSTPRKKHVF